jgi:hypothetical protein
LVAAYQHGTGEEVELFGVVVEQSKFVPGVKWGLRDEPVWAFPYTSRAAAVHAASAALWAAWRWNQQLAKSTAKPMAPIRNRPSTSNTNTVVCPRSLSRIFEPKLFRGLLPMASLPFPRLDTFLN